jgi:hypothetical protein
MRKAIGVFATMALIIALIGISMRSAPVAMEPVTAAGFRPSTGAISPYELTLNYGKSLPDARHTGDYTHVYRSR